MRQWTRDLTLSVGLIIFCIVNFIYSAATDTRTVEYRLAGATSYMQLWLSVLLVLSLILLVRTLKKKPDNVVAPMWTKLGVLTLAVLAVYLLVMPYIGFFIDTVIFLTVLIAAFTLTAPHERKEGPAFYRQWAAWLLVSLISTTVIYYLFANILKVVFPKFSLF